MKVLAVILIMIGLVGLVWGGVAHVKDPRHVDPGPVELSSAEAEPLPIPPLVSGTALGMGILFFFIGRRTDS